MSALVEFSMFPTEQTQSKSAFVARVLNIVDRSGLEYQLTPMGTIIEGEMLEEVLSVINVAYEELRTAILLHQDRLEGRPRRSSQQEGRFRRSQTLVGKDTW